MQQGLFRQFFMFGLVGALGFTIDSAVYLLTVGVLDNPYAARAISYVCAASSNWFFNRRYTFGAGRHPMWREWLSFLAVQSAGGLVNYTVFILLISLSALFAAWPVAAIAIGSIAGMSVNFTTAKLFIFRRRHAGEEAGRSDL